MLDHSYVLLARVREGVRFSTRAPPEHRAAQPVHAVFFLVSPIADPGRHLRVLAQIASRVDQDSFMPEWLGATSEEELKETLFRNERILVMTLGRERSSDLIGRPVRELSLPEGTLIAMLRREGGLLFPGGDTVLLEGDRLTVLGRAEGISILRERYDMVVTARGV